MGYLAQCVRAISTTPVIRHWDHQPPTHCTHPRQKLCWV